MNAMQKLGEILISRNQLTREQLDEALSHQQGKDTPFGQILVKLKYATEEQVLSALAEQLGLPFAEHLPGEDIDYELVSLLPTAFAKRHSVICFRSENGLVVVATADPLNYAALDDVRTLLGKNIRLVVAPPTEIVSKINMALDKLGRDVEASVEKLEEVVTEVGQIDEGILEDIGDQEDEEAPIIRLINSLLFQAAKDRASDIHIEPFENEVSIRFRIDGVLYDIIKPAKRFHSSIISRVKIMAHLNIAEKRLPQDGRIRIKLLGKDIDIRTSVIPTSHGERIVMRLLDKSAVRLDLEELGLSDQKLRSMERLIRKKHGIILVSGPTGSGKTTTLYAALTRLNSPDKNILTVEDPIEYQIKGIGQMQVNPKINLTFASGLRSFLRQDPDIILVGEIRDTETADIAIHASLTGHLVFSTLHTNDAAGAITRLLDMGIEPFLVSSSLVGILAQRLIRVLCKDCRESYAPDEAELAEIGLTPADLDGRTVYRAKGCPACNGRGYRGRTGIYELLLVSDEVRTMILRHSDSTTIRRQAAGEGMTTLREDGARKVLAGETTIEEILSVTQEDVD